MNIIQYLFCEPVTFKNLIFEFLDLYVFSCQNMRMSPFLFVSKDLSLSLNFQIVLLNHSILDASTFDNNFLCVKHIKYAEMYRNEYSEALTLHHNHLSTYTITLYESIG